MRFLIAMLLLAGCARHTPTYDSQGLPVHLIECGRHLPGCHQKAKEICGGPFMVVEKDAGIVGLPVQGGMMMGSMHTLTVRCK